ncbi:MAG: flagellar hook-associated protein FlgK [Calditrichia bacterium]
MPGIFQSLDIARRAIWASRMGMDVTSHNIANVNTEGYSRQRVLNRAATPLQLPEGQLGLGVSVETINRIRSGLLDQQYRQANHLYARASAKENLFNQIEAILQEPGDNSIGNLMNSFFLEFSNLASDPENTTIRNTIRQQALLLVDSFRNKDLQITQMQDALKNDSQSVVTQINEITRQIARLNAQIASGGSGGLGANDLRDRRDLLLDRLSEYLNITYTEDSGGQLTVVAEGSNLVSGTKANQLSLERQKNGDDLHLIIKNSNGQEASFQSGKLGALLDMHNNQLSTLREKLDTLAGSFAEEVNRIHAAGYGLPTGDPPAASTGIDFFIGNSAATIDISAEIREDVTKIAASNDGTPGNGDVALAISNIRNSKVLLGGTETLDGFYQGIVKNLAMDIQAAENTRNGQQLIKDQIQNQREAESGVSLDEEMTNLIKYQRSFEAAAKVIQVVDEMMETLVNII